MPDSDWEPWFRPYPFPIIWGPANWKGWLALVVILLSIGATGIVTSALHLPQYHPHH